MIQAEPFSPAWWVGLSGALVWLAATTAALTWPDPGLALYAWGSLLASAVSIVLFFWTTRQALEAERRFRLACDPWLVPGAVDRRLDELLEPEERRVLDELLAADSGEPTRADAYLRSRGIDPYTLQRFHRWRDRG